MSASGLDLCYILCRFGLQGGTLGTHKRQTEPKNDNFGTPFGRRGPQDQIFNEFGGAFWESFWIPFCTVAVTCGKFLIHVGIFVR